MYLLLLLLSSSAISANKDYDPALKAAGEATYIQSGFQTKFLQVKKATETRLTKFAKDNSLTDITATALFIGPVLLYKKIQIHSGKFTFDGSTDKVEGLFQFQF